MKANTLVTILLEDEAFRDKPDAQNVSPEDDPGTYVKDYLKKLEQDEKEGKITPETAQTAKYFWHKTLKYANGRRALMARRNGATKTWKTRPGEFMIPIKIGMYEYSSITHRNADEWTTIEPPPSPPRKKKKNPTVEALVND